jgi:ribosome-binding factor A
MDTTRQKKFAKEMQRAISQLLQQEVEPLFNALVTVNHVQVTADLQQVRCYLTTMPSEKLQDVLHLLNEENREFRQLLADRIRNQVRYIPTIQFYKDDTMETANRLDKLFAEIHKQDALKPPKADEPA